MEQAPISTLILTAMSKDAFLQLSNDLAAQLAVPMVPHDPTWPTIRAYLKIG